MAIILPCHVTHIGGPSVTLGDFSLGVDVVLPDGSVVNTFTDDLPKSATSIDINNAASAAAIKKYKDWPGNPPLAPPWDGTEPIMTNLTAGAV